MRYGELAAAVLAAIWIGGCTRQQKVEANSQARQAEVKVNQAAQKAGHELNEAGLTLKVKTALAASPKLNSKDIKVTTKGKTVTLLGSVPDASQKALAQRVAQDMVGADVQVVNQLQVRGAGKAE